MDGTSSAVRDGGFRALDDRRIYLVWIGLVWALVIVGFGSDFTRYLAEEPSPPPPIMHVHGMVATLWLMVATTQILLVERSKIRIHKTLGWWLVGLSVLLVPLNGVAALVDKVRQSGLPDYSPQFLSLEVEELVTFSVMMTAAVLARKKLAAHKRLMMLTVFTMLDVGPGRISDNILGWDPPGYVGWAAHYYWGTWLLVPAMMGWDLWRHRRIHPALLAGAAFLSVSEASASIAFYSPAWSDAAARLVEWWGYAG